MGISCSRKGLRLIFLNGGVVNIRYRLSPQRRLCKPLSEFSFRINQRIGLGIKLLRAKAKALEEHFDFEMSTALAKIHENLCER